MGIHDRRRRRPRGMAADDAHRRLLAIAGHHGASRPGRPAGNLHSVQRLVRRSTMLTFAQFESKVREIIAADPDHVYRRPALGVEINGCFSVICFYSTASHPDAIEACVFGQALSALGVTDEVL